MTITHPCMLLSAAAGTMFALLPASSSLTAFHGAILVLGLIGGVLYTGIENAYYSMSRLRLIVRRGRGDRAAIILEREIADANRLFSVLLIGVNFTQFLISFAITGLIQSHTTMSEGRVVLLQTFVTTPVLFVFFETVPKEAFRTYADIAIYSCADFLRWSRWIMTATAVLPLVAWLGRLITVSGVVGTDIAAEGARRRIAHLVREAVGHGAISEHQTGLIDRALSLRETPVTRAMAPWAEVDTLPANLTPSMLAQDGRRYTQARYPVLDEQGRVIGVANLLDFMTRAQTVSASDVAVPAVFIEPTATIQTAWGIMQHKAAHLAIVGSHTRPTGIVTLRDLIESLVGEMPTRP